MKTNWKLYLILIMALVAQGKVVEADDSPGLCDKQFLRVDTRTPAHMLPPGVAAAALNHRFEDGRAWPRYGIDRQAWGQVTANLIPANAKYVLTAPFAYTYTPNVAEGIYWVVFGDNDASVTSGSGQILSPGVGQGVWVDARQVIAPGVPPMFFTSKALAAPVTATVSIGRPSNICGYRRFQDPEGFDTTVLVTDDWRDKPDEDGGRGRAWRLVSNNAPQEIPMNGNDIYGVARLIPCFNGLVILRQDNERHYFQGAAVIAGDTIQLNCQPEWNDGDQVLLQGDPTQNSQFTGGTWPGNGAYCYVNNIGNNQVKLYQDPGLAHPFTFNAAAGRFFLERQALLPGYGGNGAPPLLCQPGAEGELMWDEGFLEVPDQVFVTAITGDLVTAPNHRLIPGDTINYFPAGTPQSGTPSNEATTWYACPVGPSSLYIYTKLDDALANTGANYASLPDFAAGQYVVKTTSSGQPMPPGREGFYTQQGCLVIVNGANNLFISMPLDPLHYVPLSDQVTANLGEADQVMAVAELPNQDALVIFKELSVLALYNFAEGLANSGESWTLEPITRDYGLLAPLSVVQVGSSLYFVSRRGIDQIQETGFGLLEPVEVPPSYNQAAYIGQMDWAACGAVVGATWNNRVFIAFPQIGQPAGVPDVMTKAVAGGPQNNLIMSLNLLNTSKEGMGWEGLWNGFNVYGFARLTIAGQGERLTFADSNGNVSWLGDGWVDYSQYAIPTSLTTRIYTGGTMGRKIFQTVRCMWDTYGPKLTVTAIAPGVNRLYPLAGGLTYNPLQYLQGANVPVAYNPAPQVPAFNAPFREDYTPQELMEILGNVLEQHQNITQPFRTRIDAWGMQVQIQNAKGSARIASVLVGGILGPNSDRLHA